MIRRHRPWLLLVCALLVPCTLCGQIQQLGKVVGQIRIARGDFPAHPVLVSLEMRGSPIGSAYCDEQGRFGFYSLVANHYTVSVNDDDYEPVSQTTDVNPEASSANFVQITLVPRSNGKKDPLPGRVGGSNPYLVDPADYNKRFPKKAVKEYVRGVDSEHKGKPEDAIAHYEDALKIAPDYYPAHNNLGSLYLSKSDFRSAEEQFREAVRLDQNDAQSYFNLSNVLMLTGRYTESEAALAAGLQRRPDSAFAHFLQGCLLARTGKSDEAEKSLREALQLDPSMAQAHLQLVNLYLQQNRKENAIRQLQDFLRAFPSATTAAKAREVLNKLQSQEGLRNQ